MFDDGFEEVMNELALREEVEEDEVDIFERFFGYLFAYLSPIACFY